MKNNNMSVVNAMKRASQSRGAHDDMAINKSAVAKLGVGVGLVAAAKGVGALTDPTNRRLKRIEKNQKDIIARDKGYKSNTELQKTEHPTKSKLKTAGKVGATVAGVGVAGYLGQKALRKKSKQS